MTVRFPGPLRRRIADRAADEGLRLSDAIRAAVEDWVGELSPAGRREVHRLARLSDREREATFLGSNENVRRLLEDTAS